MAFSSKFKPGGKKGPRQATSKRQPHMRMKPAPIKSHLGGGEDDEAYAAEQAAWAAYSGSEDEAEEAAYGYKEALKGEAKPLEGLRVSVSGCSGQKEDLLALAAEYGAERHGGLQDDTTHLVTDKPKGQKYQVALAQRMHIMEPSWLPTIQKAWTSGEEVDWRELEYQHAMPPLFGTVICFTHFAQGEYKEDFKRLLIAAGATLVNNLLSNVTHLVVASPASPLSPTPPSQKLLHARKNASKLHPELAVVWEGWAREAVKYGGRRPERDAAWKYHDNGQEPVEDVRWEAEVAAPRTGYLQSHLRPPPAPSTGTRLDDDFSLPTPSAAARSLVNPSSRLLTADTAPSFAGYDTSLFLDPLDGDANAHSTAKTAQTSHDVSNGKILKKRRKAVSAAPSTTDTTSLLEVYGASQYEGESRFADASTSTLYDLPIPPPPRTDGSRLLNSVLERNKARALRRQNGEEGEDGEMALELVPGEVELRYTTKSKSVIKALGKGRSESFTVEEGEGQGRQARSFLAGGKGKKLAVEGEVGGEAEDSAFFEGGGPRLSDGAQLHTSDTLRSQPPSSGSSEDEPSSPFFAGLKLALVVSPEVLGSVQKAVVDAAGTYVIDPDEESDEYKGADYVVVDHINPPTRFRNSPDPRVVTICWVELCVFCDELRPLVGGLFERPLPYQCPVPGMEELSLHFSNFGELTKPIYRFNIRFAEAIGATHTGGLRTTTTHLVLGDLDANPDADLAALAVENPKITMANARNIPVVSLSWLRNAVQERAAEVTAEAAVAGMKGMAVDGEAKTVGSGSGKGRSVRDITNELDERQGGEEESMQGPLRDCVVFFSPKLEIDRQAFATIVEDLGGFVARQYSASVTHFVHSGLKASESFKDFRAAKNDGAYIVHPRWIEECGRTSTHASEGDFPHTFDARKGGQLFDIGMSVSANAAASPPRSQSMSRNASTSSQPLRGAADGDDSVSKASLGRSGSVSPPARSSRNSPSGRKPALDLDADEPKPVPSPPASPVARRRRSDTTATEVADEATVDNSTVYPSLHRPPPNKLAAQPYSSSPALPAHLAEASIDSLAGKTVDPSSDGLDIPPLRSEVERPPGGKAGKTQLRNQTSLLAQLMEEPKKQLVGKTSRTLNRKKSSNVSTHSAGSAPTDSNSRRLANGSYPFEPTQQTQDEESLYVLYDNQEEAKAREQIRLALAAGSNEGVGGVEPQESTTPGRRRSTRAAAASKH